MQWLNEPQQWSDVGGIIKMTAAAQTDFWRVTRHGYIVDNGHFYYREVTGDFTVTVQFSAAYQALYDQAGLMLRLDEKTWVKCGIEHVTPNKLLSVVVTREFSDWSTAPQPVMADSVWFKIVRIDSAIEVSCSLDGSQYTMLREAYFIPAPTLQVGLMCAAPRGDGFEATFRDLTITQN
jgi:regulation of enolase protein 1 (concanavalin A-like superfamily)